MDWNGLAISLVDALRVPLIVFVVWGAKKLIPKLPRVTLPLLAVAFGVLADWIVAQAGGQPTGPVVAALLGAAATWLRELANTVREHGASA